MGLDISYDAFHGAYSAFNRFRQIVAQAAGGSYPPHYLINGDGSTARDDRGFPISDKSLNHDDYYLESEWNKRDGLRAFLSHSDCDGEISPEMCLKVANDLTDLLPEIEHIESVEEAHGHISARGGYVEVTKKFINGCLAAHKEGKPLDFH